MAIQIGDSLDLTPPWEGVFFDILGRNSFPSAFTKTLISWLSPASRGGIYFIALPGADGAVRGIDQLFGDNTTGPDGRFASNGFAALAKYGTRRLRQPDQNEICRHDDRWRYAFDLRHLVQLEF